MTISAPTRPDAPGHLFCFGLGYTAERLALRLRATGWTISGTVRTPVRQAALRERGIATCLFGPGMPLTDPRDRLSTVTHLVASIPPAAAGDPALNAHGNAIRDAGNLGWIGYLSTPAVYGDRGGALVSEDDTPAPASLRGRRRLAAEQAWAAVPDNGRTAVQIFRLSGIYGPGRNVIRQVRTGTARIIDKPGQVFNRIHVDDIGTILMASMARPTPGRIYNVADSEACSSGDVVRHACRLLGVEPPAPVPFGSAELSAMARSFYSECKRLDTRRLTEELGVTLRYPTYRDGLTALLRED